MVPGTLVGRESELERIAGFLRSIGTGPAGLLLEGEAGAGKTTLWEEALRAVDAGIDLRQCRPVQSEATLSYAGLGDLLGSVAEASIAALPGPQRRALAIALGWDDAPQRAADHRAVGAATLSLLSAEAGERPIVIAIDDLQWLDRASARAVGFAFRRLADEPIRLLATVRPESTAILGAEHADVLQDRRVEHLHLAPLSVGAVERLLRDRLDLALPRTGLVHLHETSRGNPFFALELGRALAEADARPVPGEPLPVPDDLHVLLLERVRRLPPDVRDALLLASLLAQPVEDTLARAVGAGWDRARDRARSEGILAFGQGSIRFDHPLLASTVVASASPRERRAAHARLAAAVDDEEQRARHLALAAPAADGTVADALEAAAGHARRRGAPDAAAELAELARSLTPTDRAHDVWRRCIEAGGARFSAGDSSLAAENFGAAADAAAPGAERADALIHLARVRFHHDDVTGARELLDEARVEAGDDVALRAAIEHDLVYPAFAAGDLASTLRHGRAAVELAEQIDAPEILAGALSQVAVAEFLLGEGLRWDALRRARELEDWDDPQPAALRPTFITAHVLAWTDRIEESRDLLLDGERELRERGDEGGLPWVWYRLAELDCWSGHWDRGYARAIEADRLAVRTGQGAIRPPTCYAVALLAAHLGRVDEARAAIDEGVASGMAAKLPIGVAANLGVLGFLEHSLGRPEQAHQVFAPLVAANRAGGLAEPVLLFWLPDAIEVLVAIGRHEEAGELVEWLEVPARAGDRPSGLAVAARGRALLLAATGDPIDALAACDEALRYHARVDLPFASARTLLVKGQIARRARKWGVARAALDAARAAFEALGAVLWSDRARDELARIGGRPAAPQDLSETERQIAELVATGLSNKEVAETLFVSPRTVSSTLARVYRKLGVASRTEMAARLDRSAPPS
jgi:DNA-binding CsgD family transcriptional regulator